MDNYNGDCISRNSVIMMFNIMDRYYADKLILQDTNKEFPHNEVFIVDDCYEALDELPSVNPHKSKGCWIPAQFGFDKCSCCDSLWRVGITRNMFTRYCPKCGAKMQNDEEDLLR